MTLHACTLRHARHTKGTILAPRGGGGVEKGDGVELESGCEASAIAGATCTTLPSSTPPLQVTGLCILPLRVLIEGF